MNINMPLSNYIPMLLNGFNLVLGYVSLSDINVLSAYFGFIVSGMWQLYRIYRKIKADSRVDKYADIMDTTLTSVCVVCQKEFEPSHDNQIFCSDGCTQSFLNRPTRQHKAGKK